MVKWSAEKGRSLDVGSGTDHGRSPDDGRGTGPGARLMAVGPLRFLEGSSYRSSRTQRRINYYASLD